MDKSRKYRKILKNITQTHAQMFSPMTWVQSTAVSDFAQNNFFLIDFDSSDKKHYIVFHLRLANEKILIIEDGIEEGIARDLIEAGVLAADIISPSTDQNQIFERELLAA